MRLLNGAAINGSAPCFWPLHYSCELAQWLVKRHRLLADQLGLQWSAKASRSTVANSVLNGNATVDNATIRNSVLNGNALRHRPWHRQRGPE